MSDDHAELARLLAVVAADLDHRGYPAAGVLRRAARMLVELPEAADEGCAGCGAELVQVAGGRPRRWCSESCRNRVRRR